MNNCNQNSNKSILNELHTNYFNTARKRYFAYSIFVLFITFCFICFFPYVMEYYVSQPDENIFSYEKDGIEHHITNANTLIFANGYHVDPSIEEMLKELNMTYYLIGDGHKVGNIKDAINEGYEITKAI